MAEDDKDVSRIKLLTPEKYFSRVSQIDVEKDLLNIGLNHALLDIDNTIRSRSTHDVPKDVRNWIAKARDAGISFCLLSNNWHSDIHSFAEHMDLPIVAKAMKPLPIGFSAAMKKIGGNRTDSVVIGDQLMTDVLGAHLVGMKAFLVLPLAEVDLKHTLLLRNFERLILGELRPEGAGINASVVENCDMNESG